MSAEDFPYNSQEGIEVNAPQGQTQQTTTSETSVTDIPAQETTTTPLPYEGQKQSKIVEDPAKAERKPLSMIVEAPITIPDLRPTPGRDPRFNPAPYPYRDPRFNPAPYPYRDPIFDKLPPPYGVPIFDKLPIPEGLSEKDRIFFEAFKEVEEARARLREAEGRLDEARRRLEGGPAIPVENSEEAPKIRLLKEVQRSNREMSQHVDLLDSEIALEDQVNRTEQIPVADATEKEEDKETPTERKLGIVDDKLDDLLILAGNSREAEQEAIKIFVDQVRQIGEQMTLVRDAKNLQELKLLMNEQWEELVAATGGDKALLAEIQKWGDDFVESKALYYDLMNDIKLEINNKAMETTSKWTDIQITMGEAIRSTNLEAREVRQHIDKILYHDYSLWEHVGFGIDMRPGGDAYNIPIKGYDEKFSYLEKFIESVNRVEKGYDKADIDIQSLATFSQELSKVLGYLASQKEVPMETLRRLSAEIKEFNKITTETVNTYMATKKLRDTHFLDIFNRGVSGKAKREEGTQT